MLLLTAIVILVVATRWLAWQVEQRFPASGRFATIDGVKLHYIDVPGGPDADLLPMIFLHGASGNARDPQGAYAQALAGRARLVFVDRPGAGYSQRGGAGMEAPDAQARLVAGLMEHLKIGRAVIVGHSLGASIAVALAVDHPARVAGLVLTSPATHPWPGGAVTWYYNIASFPVLGRAFAETLAVPFGHLLYPRAVKSVFAPDRVVADFDQRSGTHLVLRPGNFLHNAQDVAGLYQHVARLAPRYREIKAPTVIVTGDSDGVVLAEIHSEGLARDISGSKLVWLERTGHTPTYTATARIVAEIEMLNARMLAAAR
ncbi:MAG TPA: alpha/beta hydrolase [Rhizobiaceae bacterium]|nr:alpha/beta hydrolase [Rhizobiaceae bacterium]